MLLLGETLVNSRYIVAIVRVNREIKNALTTFAIRKNLTRLKALGTDAEVESKCRVKFERFRRSGID